jgi:alkyldihydroxyacetonephosphate synthase
MIAIDRTSLTAEVSGETTLRDLEAELARHGLTLDVDVDVDADDDATIAAWLAVGAPGARDAWRDPVDHLVAGFDARLPNGTALRVRPGPRRAVGPDLLALFFGARSRFGTITRAHLRVHPKGTPRPESPPFAHDRDPEPPPGEGGLWDAIARELGGKT